ncbi:hypothetical protein BOTBODRAFT_625693 [Botryobasidium botryosum FD-172 SS1]|uniref:Altered inheritance of mitochondria protein 9, mitochondrial n=1 Tax=Botryobasidium botryosum (strain FD-172 SS1) TaxID=930990 RepID=A0A067MJU2_BOTB1|nr:hypothetical protein BOTBODRAFT_625693 [Botryobasidium botryosum FD-172 SS1]
MLNPVRDHLLISLRSNLHKRARTLCRESERRFLSSPAAVEPLQSLRSVSGNDQGTKYEDFYRCSTKRWIYNEKQQFALRYVKFDAPALQRIATEVIGAAHCISMEKLAEGSFNKIFLLRFDNEKELIARIPCPIAGPPHLTVASEVATIEFARTRLNLPVPKVFAWSSCADDTDVGAAYILMEKVPGVTLADRRADIGSDVIIPFARSVVSVEKKFSEIPFSQIGSLYFKEDVAIEPQERRLYAEGIPDDEASERFRIGPTVQREFWRGERAGTDNVDRGPWPDLQSYGLAIANCERRWLKRFARPRALDNPFRLSDEQESIEAHLAMLDRFASILPLLKLPPELLPLTLWHTDLHEGNVVVEPDGFPGITGIIDWQNTWIGPRFIQAKFAPLFAYEGTLFDPRKHKPPEWPSNFDELDEEEKAEWKEQFFSLARHKLYEISLRTRHQEHRSVLTYPHLKTMVLLFHSASRTWTDGLVSLRQALIKVAAHWETIAGPGVHCPLSFGEAELEDHEEIYARLGLYEGRLQTILEAFQISQDGAVEPERYEAVMQALEPLREFWDDERDGGPWPLQDGGWSSLF